MTGSSICKPIQNRDQILRIRRHVHAFRRIGLCHGRATIPAQVGSDHLADFRERFDLRSPHLMIKRKAMNQQQRHAFARGVTGELQIAY